MFRDRFLKRIFFFVVFAALAFPAMLGQLGKVNPFNPLGVQQHAAPVMTDARRQHILHGDKTGGGHLYGTGHPCKSEFPQHWKAEDIIHTVTVLAANDNLGWKKQKNGNHVAEADQDGLTIRIVVNREKGEIVTAYPLNVPRNACGKKQPANDN